MKIDFVSDVACPWCAVGLSALEIALARIGDSFPVELRFEPFELNPQMRAEGEDANAYLGRKYGRTPEQLGQARQMLRERGAAVGFVFGERARVWNTFDAHRMLAWAATVPGAQRKLKHALLAAYHTHGENPGSHKVLLRLVGACGLDVAQAGRILASDAYAVEVRARERFWQQQGIDAVPAVVIDDRHLISGGQPPEVFERALREIAAAGPGGGEHPVAPGGGAPR